MRQNTLKTIKVFLLQTVGAFSRSTRSAYTHSRSQANYR